jgi:GNAT superfamily N-acetyltransferase
MGGNVTPADGVTLRHHRPGDMGNVIREHGLLYSTLYGWDQRFEALVARICADFIDQLQPDRERCWIAERGITFLGCAFVVVDHDAPNTAKLRLVLVTEPAQGLGLGRTLVREAITFARTAGYGRMVLWTNSVLHAARHIYETEGFRLVREEPHSSFGTTLVGQYWERDL